MSQLRPRFTGNDWLLTSAILLVSIAAALAIRILWPYDSIFVDGGVWFREMDAWYHMRLVDSLIHNFPHTTAFDPYTYFPNGINSVFHPLTSWLIAVPALLLGGGNPSPALVDACGAYMPPILGALTVVPVYFIGRHLYGRVAGAASAILIAILPGEFLSRSLLGFTDHHVAEAIFSTTALLFLMSALREASMVGVILRRPADLLFPAYRRTLLFAVLAGVSLGLYLLAWRGGVLVLAILVLYAAIRCAIDYSRADRGDDIVLVFALAGAIAMLLASPTIASHSMATLYVLAMMSVVLVPVALRLLSDLGHHLHWSPSLFLAALGGSLGLAFLALLLVSPTLAGYVRGAIDFMVPEGAHLSIMEMQPLFFPGGTFSLTVAWNNFTTALALSIVALAVLIRSSRSPRGNDVGLLFVWSLVMLVAVFLQRRFGYYYAINTAILCGFLVAWVSAHPSVKRQMEILRHRVAIPVGAKPKTVAKTLRSYRAERRTAMTKLTIVVVIIVAVLYVPSVDMARKFATEPGLMTPGWYETLTWMRDNTPPPLDPDAYYGLYDVPANREPFPYPPTAYGVMAWWDYGHWITRLAQRMPLANPFQQGARTAARFFTSQSEADGENIMDQYDARYVVVDSVMSQGKFYGVAGWAGQERADYFDIYSQRNSSGTSSTVVLYYPEYYQTMLVRLYNFGGLAYEPQEFTAIRFQESQSGEQAVREIVEVRQFTAYSDALTFLSQASDSNWQLASPDPLVSAIPLTKLQGFTKVYESSVQTSIQGRILPNIRVFEYVGAQR